MSFGVLMIITLILLVIKVWLMKSYILRFFLTILLRLKLSINLGGKRMSIFLTFLKMTLLPLLLLMFLKALVTIAVFPLLLVFSLFFVSRAFFLFMRFLEQRPVSLLAACWYYKPLILSKLVRTRNTFSLYFMRMSVASALFVSIAEL
ncbi:hypothetical protein [Microvirus mar65]|uniref:Uncharacterized protein n=1 Tax=Microvirus mar65 TaxID=2851202 RepID=A0A8F5RC59_9VIRU|nr:hypothetical protein [Microvirus mar65]